jgi:hypothetical protein
MGGTLSGFFWGSALANIDPGRDVITEVKEFEGPHLLPAWPGWEKVADWALERAAGEALLPHQTRNA